MAEKRRAGRQQAVSEHPEIVVPSPPRVYTRGEMNVVLPMVVRQDLPSAPAEFGSYGDGLMEPGSELAGPEAAGFTDAAEDLAEGAWRSLRPFLTR